MSMFLESPLPIIVVGVVIEAILGAVLVNTRRGAILWAMLAVLILVGIGLLVERLVVTEKERITATLDGAADALEANDLDRLLGYLAPSAGTSRARAQQVLGMVEFTSVAIRGLEIGPVNRLTSPPTVETKFTATIGFNDRTGAIPYNHHVVGLIVHLRKEGDRWLVTDHIEEDPNNPLNRRRR
jgi:hypothetical protein